MGDSRILSYRLLPIISLVVGICSFSFGRPNQDESYSEPTDDLDTLRAVADATRLYTSDAGDWIAVRLGFEANGGELKDRYSVAASYEQRLEGAFSWLGEYQIWRHRLKGANGDIATTPTTYGMITLGAKFRTKLSKFSFGIQGGLGTGVGLSPFCFYYSMNLDYFLGRKFALTLSQKRFSIPDFEHFFFFGITVKI